MPVKWLGTDVAPQLTNPTRFNPSARVINVANQISVLQACAFPSTSFQLNTRAPSNSDIPSSATLVAFMNAPPKIQRANASRTTRARIISGLVTGPSLSSPREAQAGTSRLFFTLGG